MENLVEKYTTRTKTKKADAKENERIPAIFEKLSTKKISTEDITRNFDDTTKK